MDELTRRIKERIDHDDEWSEHTFNMLLDLPNEEANQFIRTLLIEILQPQLNALIEQEVERFAQANNPDLPAPFFSKERSKASLWRLSKLKAVLKV